MDVLHPGNSLCRQTGNDQCRTGPEIVESVVPNVVGLSYDKAYSQLTNLGFIVPYERKTDNAPKDEVIGQSVPKGTDWDLTEKVVLTISKGPQTVPQTMISDIGKDYDKA